MDPSSNGLLSTFIASLVVAFGGGLAARSVHLPPLLGYLLAGIMVGPFTPGFIANQEVAGDLASVGVALLMFNIGLHFSIKDLLAVRRIALVGGLTQVTVSTIIGATAAYFLLQATPLACLVTGLCFAIASTAVSVRLLEERHQVATFPGRVALGWLVLQDIVVIFALVMLPSLSGAETLSSVAIMKSLGRALFQIAGFVIVMLVVGRRLIPSLLGFVARVGSRELFTLAVIVIALGIAYGSSLLFGVSLALGAFFAGVVIGESDLNHHAAAEVLAMQQIFTILFFVSVGMLFDPATVMRWPWTILGLWLVVVVGMGVVTFGLLLALRVPIEAAALVGVAFAQVGEFTFVLSELGLDWGILTKNDRDIILATALLSMTLNPFLMAVLPRLARRLASARWIARWYKEGQIAMPPAAKPLANHVILVGHGRVGRLIAEAFVAHDIPHVIIENDRRLMEKLRHSQKPVIFGDAAREAVLRAAHPETARLMILAVPDGGQARRIATHVHRLFPTLEVIARVHADADARYMSKQGVALCVMGERETALGLSGFALRHLGVESDAVLQTLDKLRESRVL
jgi:CPA2 family monovalent cation:H+ antiporter-2